MSDASHDIQSFITRGISNTTRNFEGRVDTLVSQQVVELTNIDNSIPTKACSVCGKVLPFTSFHKNRSKANGIQSECKECKNKAARKYTTTIPCKNLQNGQSKSVGQSQLDIPVNYNVKSTTTSVEVTHAINNALSELLAKSLNSTPEEVIESALKHYMSHVLQVESK